MTRFGLIRLTLDELDPSPGFADWLARERMSIAITKGNSLFLIGLAGDGSVAFIDCQFGLCMGLATTGPDTLFLATRYQLWRLENALPPGATDDAGHDRIYLPQTAWTTGTLLVRDLAIEGEGTPLFVNGLFSCLSTVSGRLSFEPTWLPPFVSGLAPEDRCYLSGLALEDGQPAVVTSASRSDRRGGWREHQRDGGVVVSVTTGEVIATGLSMPYSPLLADGRLWLCLGGSGELATIDRADGGVTAVAELPGFTRGLEVRGGRAVVATSGPHRGETFDGLPLSDRLHGSDAAGRCGIFVIELESGRVEHSLLFSGGSSEIHGLRLLPGVRFATAVPFTGSDVQELVTVPEMDEPGRRVATTT